MKRNLSLQILESALQCRTYQKCDRNCKAHHQHLGEVQKQALDIMIKSMKRNGFALRTENVYWIVALLVN